MLEGIHPLLTGQLLHWLDEMGHSDAVVVADAHFPARRLGDRVLDLPGTSSPAVVAALRTVLPIDAPHALSLMETAEHTMRDIQHELIDSADLGDSVFDLVERFAFYDAAQQSFLIIRTGETREYGNALLRKGHATPLAV